MNKLIKEIKKIGEKTMQGNSTKCTNCGNVVKDSDILVKNLWVYADIIKLLDKYEPPN